MTVYVDDWRQPARVGRITARWSHLTVGPYDDLAELHRFAASIGLRRSWFQDKPWPYAHYDVTDAKRRAAITAGAVSITWREGGEQRRAARADSGRHDVVTSPADSSSSGTRTGGIPSESLSATHINPAREALPMPTIYTRGPAKVEITEQGGGGCGVAVLIGVIVLASAGAGIARFVRELQRGVDEVLSIALTVLEVAGCVAGTAVAVAVVAFVVRKARQRAAVSAAQTVHVITDAAPSRQLETPSAALAQEDTPELTAGSAWSDEQWIRDIRSQRWAGIPREWSEPAGSWPDEWNQWGERR
jgi:Protein of unknown function (DUF4031)